MSGDAIEDLRWLTAGRPADGFFMWCRFWLGRAALWLILPARLLEMHGNGPRYLSLDLPYRDERHDDPAVLAFVARRLLERFSAAEDGTRGRQCD